jgi:uncharacterized protein
VDDPDRAEKFYSSVFGWTFDRYPGAPEYYGMATTGDTEPGINGALFQRQNGSETTITMSVDSIEEAVERITSAGGKVIQDKTPIPSMGWFATCEDTEGNKFGLFTNDPNAA